MSEDPGLIRGGGRGKSIRRRTIEAILRHTPMAPVIHLDNGPVIEKLRPHRRPLAGAAGWVVVGAAATAAGPLAFGQFVVGLGQIGGAGLFSSIGLTTAAAGAGATAARFLELTSDARASHYSTKAGEDLESDLSDELDRVHRSRSDTAWNERNQPRSRWNIDLTATADVLNNSARNLLATSLRLCATASLVVLVPLTAGGALLIPTLSMLVAMMVPNAIAVRLGWKRLNKQHGIGEETVAGQVDRDVEREKALHEPWLEDRRQTGQVHQDRLAMKWQIARFGRLKRRRQLFGLHTSIGLNRLSAMGSAAVIVTMLGFAAFGFPMNAGMLAAATTMLSAQAALAQPIEKLPHFLDRLLTGMKASLRIDRALRDTGRLAGRIGLQRPAPFDPERLTIHLDGVGFSQANLRDVNLEISDDPGLVLIQGSNGTGKSTLVRIISGTVAPDFGQLLYEDAITGEARDGRNVDPDDIARLIGYVTQEPVIDGSPTVRQVLTQFSPRTTDAELRSYLREIESPLALDDVMTRPSGGERAVLKVGAQLFGPKRILIFDEVDAAVDRTTRENLLARVRRESAVRKVVVITHHKDEVLQGVPSATILLGRSQGPINRPIALITESPMRPNYFQEYTRRDRSSGLQTPLQDGDLWHGTPVIRTRACKVMGIALVPVPQGQAPTTGPPRHWSNGHRINARTPVISGDKLLNHVRRGFDHAITGSQYDESEAIPSDAAIRALDESEEILVDIVNAVQAMRSAGNEVLAIPAEPAALDDPSLFRLFRQRAADVRLKRGDCVEL